MSAAKQKRAERVHTQVIVWTSEMDALVGRLPDATVGSKFAISGEAVRRRRLKLKRDACRPERTWSERDNALLGTDTDERVAKRLGVSALAVRIRRHRLGVKPFSSR